MPERFTHLHFDSVDSTNDICLRECKKSSFPVVVTADSQKKGRGRNQKKWSSPHGSISFSYGYKNKGVDQSISVKTGLIVAEAIKKILDIQISLKWPNDLIFNNKKIGGILVESENIDSIFYVVIGVGINLNIVPKESHWGDLNIDASEMQKKKGLIQEMSKGLMRLDDLEKREWQQDWLAKCIHVNKEVTLNGGKKSFIFLGIDDEGKMLLKDESNSIKPYSDSSITVKGLY